MHRLVLQRSQQPGEHPQDTKQPQTTPSPNPSRNRRQWAWRLPRTLSQSSSPQLHLESALQLAGEKTTNEPAPFPTNPAPMETGRRAQENSRTQARQLCSALISEAQHTSAHHIFQRRELIKTKATGSKEESPALWKAPRDRSSNNQRENIGRRYSDTNQGENETKSSLHLPQKSPHAQKKEHVKYSEHLRIQSCSERK